MPWIISTRPTDMSTVTGGGGGSDRARMGKNNGPAGLGKFMSISGTRVR
jgi:hypothetical protein